MHIKFKKSAKIIAESKKWAIFAQFLARTARVCEVKSEDKFLAKLLINGKLRS